MGRAELVIGDILGGNRFNMTLLLLVDALDGGEPVLRQVDGSAMTASLLAILLTMLYLIGLVERRDRSVLRMGYDSIVVVVVYVAGIAAIVPGVMRG
jgi:cation:H+ antiporter